LSVYFNFIDQYEMTDLWEMAHKGGDLGNGHNTPKPVSVIEKQLVVSSEGGGIVLDPFAGSGTTAVACENLGRQARLIEISPAYCAVILERLAGLGLTPTRVASTGAP
jgi:site-specific DNA-methyltransferase (adenine-specific)